MFTRLRIAVLALVVAIAAGLGLWLALERPGDDIQFAEPETGLPTAPETRPPETAARPPSPSIDQPTRGIGGGSSTIRASRLFAGPNQFPPETFAAYGIVAFRARASSGERERHVMLCEAYVATLPRSDELAVPVAEQMVTVWPISDDKTADELNELGSDGVCEAAISGYGLAVSLQALRDAGEERIGHDRRGPFLLAWAPAVDKGKVDALMLVADLSDVTTYAQAEAVFVLWRNDIEANPEYWGQGWNVEQLRLAIQLWVDRYGSQIFSILGG